jgi:hypothetical protein
VIGANGGDRRRFRLDALVLLQMAQELGNAMAVGLLGARGKPHLVDEMVGSRGDCPDFGGGGRVLSRGWAGWPALRVIRLTLRGHGCAPLEIETFVDWSGAGHDSTTPAGYADGVDRRYRCTSGIRSLWN